MISEELAKEIDKVCINLLMNSEYSEEEINDWAKKRGIKK